MSRDSSTSLAPGFRFHPTDEELVRFYLKRKVTGKSFRFDAIGVVDVYKSEPWDLPYQSKLKTRDLEWYFFSPLDKKYGHGSRTNRATEKGYWKTTGKDRAVLRGSQIVGMKKTLVYHIGRAPSGKRTNWVMHEYRLVDEELAKAGIFQDAFVLCRIFEKSGPGPKNGERYGAPLIEEEWEDDEVAPVPVDVAVSEAVAVDSAFVETDDLEQKLDMNVAFQSSSVPPNFYYGESSNSTEKSQEFIDDKKSLVGTFGISEPENGQFINMPEQYAVDIKPMNGEVNGELNHNRHSLNFSYELDDLFVDAFDDSLIGDGSFLETNDLVNPVEANPSEADPSGTDNLDGNVTHFNADPVDPVEANPSEADPSGTDIVDEYLTYFNADDDISQYICFDSPQDMGSEKSISDQEPVFIQQNVDGEIKDVSMATNDFKAHSSCEASSSKQNPQASKLVSGDTYSFVKHANELLGNIPAPPAFASEFPPKEIALRIHPAVQSSDSVHVTTGMIRIADVTLRGNEMDWTLGKNGELNYLFASGFPQPDVNYAALVPVSGLLSSKISFVLSHGWVYLMCFSVLILSVSFKVGSFMHAAK